MNDDGPEGRSIDVTLTREDVVIQVGGHKIAIRVDEQGWIVFQGMHPRPVELEVRHCALSQTTLYRLRSP